MSRFTDLYRRATEGHVPINVSVELTHRCNLRCRHCYIPDLERADGVSTARWLSLLEELAEMGTMCLVVSGGEPLLRREWSLIVKRARELGFEVRLFTNGTLVDASVARELAALHVAVEITYHSIDEATFDEVCGTPGAYRRVRTAIDHLRRSGVDLKLKMPLTVANLHQVDEVQAFADNIGAAFSADPRIVHRKDGDPGPVAWQLPHTRLLSYYRRPQTRFASLDDCGPGPASDSVLCGAASRTCNITAAGDVLSCPVMPEVAGNINQQAFSEIWRQSPWLRRLREIRRRDLDVCDSCPKLAFCARCPAQALVEDGNLLGPSRWACARAAAIEAAGVDDAQSGEES